MMSKKTAVVTLCCIIIFSFGTSSVLGQKKEIDLKDKRLTIKMELQPLGVVFKYLIENYDIPIGFEESTLDRGHPDFNFYANLPGQPQHSTQTPDGSVKVTFKYVGRVFKAGQHPITLNVENESLKEVFNQIVEQMENYKWKIKDGVVNIFPVKARDERFARLLGMNVRRFTFDKGKTVEDITTNILALPEVEKVLKDNKLIFSGIRYGTATLVLDAQYGRTINVGMDFSNLTFRALLNKITRIKGGGWILKWKWKSKSSSWETIDIDI
ncbi:MAG: hypothetical protein QOJ64_3604 [Acidobacteriota bacterium]|jgi:hypothetical protein|nr:hypothetical protein [Acidobacteriota bacterium]